MCAFKCGFSVLTWVLIVWQSIYIEKHVMIDFHILRTFQQMFLEINTRLVLWQVSVTNSKLSSCTDKTLWNFMSKSSENKNLIKLLPLGLILSAALVKPKLPKKQRTGHRVLKYGWCFLYKCSGWQRMYSWSQLRTARKGLRTSWVHEQGDTLCVIVMT